MAKMTPVEWFFDKINGMDTAVSIYAFKELFEQAKQMEKQQIIEAMDVCQRTDFYVKYEDGEQYYNETFKTK